MSKLFLYRKEKITPVFSYRCDLEPVGLILITVFHDANSYIKVTPSSIAPFQLVEHVNAIVDLGFIEFSSAILCKHILSIMIINVKCDFLLSN